MKYFKTLKGLPREPFFKLLIPILKELFLPNDD